MNRIVIYICMFTAGVSALPASGQDFRRELQTAYELQRQGRTTAAAELFEKLHRERPKDPMVFSRLKDIYIQTGRYDDALTLVKEREKSYPADPMLPISEGHIYYRQNKKKKALALWQDVIEHNRRNQSVYIMIANNMLQERLVDDALDVYRRGREALGKPHLFAFYVANIYASLMEYGKAAEELLAHLVHNPAQQQIVENQLLRLAQTETDAREIEEKIRQVIADHQELTGLYLTISFICLQTGQDARALKAAAAFEAGNHGPEKGAGMLQLGRRAFNSGHVKTALKAFRIILDDTPQFSRQDIVLYEAAACYAAMDRCEDAADLYDRLPAAHPDSPLVAPALLKSAELYSDQCWNARLAEERCRLLRRRFPGTSHAIKAGLILANVYIRAADTAAADSICTSLLSSGTPLPDAVQVHALVLKAQLRMYEHDLTGARQTLSFIDSTKLTDPELSAPEFNDGLELKLLIEEYAGSAPEALNTWADVACLQRQHRPADALSHLDSYLTSHPDTPVEAEFILQKTDLLLTLQRQRDLLNFLEQTYKRYTHHRIADRILVTAARAAAAIGRDDRAAQLYETLLFDHPGSRFADEAREKLRNREEGK